MVAVMLVLLLFLAMSVLTPRLQVARTEFPDCWSPCGGKSGPCEGYCGAGGKVRAHASSALCSCSHLLTVLARVAVLPSAVEGRRERLRPAGGRRQHPRLHHAPSGQK